MRIKCPHCGERGLDEFVFHGDAAPLRPDPAAPTAPDDFVAYAFERANAAGVNDELWQHILGCRAWLAVTRNVVTHEIADVAIARDVALLKRTGAKEGAS